MEMVVCELKEILNILHPKYYYVRFDLSKKEEQLKCFNYKNLQPLFAKDNLSKAAREVCHS